MRWHLSHRFDPAALPLADRHYSRQQPGTSQYVKPGRCICLLTENHDALWVSSWQQPEYVDHAWPAWECALFRNEGPDLSSELIREAVAATSAIWIEPPDLGFITFVDPKKVRPKADPGYCFIKAGWQHIGETAKGKLVFRLHPQNFGLPERPLQRSHRELPLFSSIIQHLSASTATQNGGEAQQWTEGTLPGGAD